MGRFYITTPIYYVNDVPHIGHAYTTTAADVAARFHRQLGDDVFFLTGTDEHGTKVEQAAAARGLTPKEHVDEVVAKFKEVANKVDASNDFFIRTTDPEHERFVQDFVKRCYNAGDIYKSSYSGLYCPACEAYYIEENLADGLCPDHGTKPVHMDEDNYFFRLSAFQDRLAAHYKSKPDFVRPRHRYNEALSFIEQGLDDISISRATLKWGIGVPWDDTQVIYVWVDALINYLSALSYAPGQDLVSRFWPASYHLMAQDILKFHGIIWPALLMSAGYELPEHLFIHGYLKLGGEKMSKTRGNVMDPFPLIEQYGADPFRFYCMREVSFGQDGMVSEEGFKARYNSELANDLGNLLSRSTSMIGKYRGGTVPAPPPGRLLENGASQPEHDGHARDKDAGSVISSAIDATEDVVSSRTVRSGGRGSVLQQPLNYADAPECTHAHPGSPLAVEATSICAAVRTQLEDMDLTAALETIWTFVRRLNRYVEEQAPWKLAKEAAAEGAAGQAAAGRLDATLWDLAEGLRLLSVLLHAFIPSTAAAIRVRLGLDGADPGWHEARWGLLPGGLSVTAGAPLFPRIED